MLTSRPEINVWAASKDNLTALQAAESAGQSAVVQFFRRDLKVFSGINLKQGVRLRGRLSVADSQS